MNDGDRFGELDEPFAEDRSDVPSETTASAPDIEAPRPEVPSTDVPTPETPSTNPERLTERYDDADPEFKALFWKLILLYKVGLIGLWVGLLLLVFSVTTTWGTALTVGGGVALGYAVLLTRRAKARLDDGEYEHSVASES